MASTARCHPHLADTRLEHLTPASSGTLSDLPTQGSGGRAVLGLKWVARSAAAYLESSPGGGLSLSPPNTSTAPKAGFCAAHWVEYGPALPHPSHLGLLRVSAPMLSVFLSRGGGSSRL